METQAQPLPHVSKGRGPFHCPVSKSFTITGGLRRAFASKEYCLSQAVCPIPSRFKTLSTYRALASLALASPGTGRPHDGPTPNLLFLLCHTTVPFPWSSSQNWEGFPFPSISLWTPTHFWGAQGGQSSCCSPSSDLLALCLFLLSPPLLCSEQGQELGPGA